MNILGQKVLVIGMARSGIAAAKILYNKGAHVTIYDQKSTEKLEKEIKSLENFNITYFLGKEPVINRENFDFVVTSPGVPLTAGPLVKAKEKGIEIVGELELAYRLSNSPIIGVTGTNGKTTTTALIGEILQTAQLNRIVAGNIGIPLIQEVLTADQKTWLVVEVSSFQLETIHDFHPRVAVLLNLTPDHLDRHKTFENYLKTKARIFLNQSFNDYAVLNYDDQNIKQISREINSNVIFFSKNHRLDKGVFIENGVIKVRWDDNFTKDIINWEEVKLKGQHNLENVMAAVGVSIALKIELNKVRKALKEFKGVAHRLEPVGRIGTVDFINDSKGTNPEATINAVEAYKDRKIVLIAGGMDKGSSFDELAKVLARASCKVIVFGETAEKIRKAVNKAGIKDCYRVNNLDEAIAISLKVAETNGVVLLSPACASWDMYSSYEERGEHFRSLVMKLMG